MSTLIELPNIGKDTVNELRAAGIQTVEQLKELGSKKAWLELQKVDSSVCLHRLLGLEGAIQGIPKKMISAEVKAELREFFEKNKR